MIGNQFKWFVGVVEDRDDPSKIGRVRVRVHGLHSEKKSIAPTNELPWAHVLNSSMSASVNGIGISPTGINVGTTVVGFFMDGNMSNIPVVLGTLTSLGADGNNTNIPKEAIGIDGTRKIPYGVEPPPAFGAKYPYNKVIRTESGHLLELDDTPNKERVHIFHKSGSYVEINNDGTITTKSEKDNIEVSIGKKTVYVKGDINIVSETGDITISAAPGRVVYINP